MGVRKIWKKSCQKQVKVSFFSLKHTKEKTSIVCKSFHSSFSETNLQQENLKLNKVLMDFYVC